MKGAMNGACKELRIDSDFPVKRSEGMTCDVTVGHGRICRYGWRVRVRVEETAIVKNVLASASVVCAPTPRPYVPTYS